MLSYTYYQIALYIVYYLNLTLIMADQVNIISLLASAVPYAIFNTAISPAITSNGGIIN